MDIMQAREYALSLYGVTEALFGDGQWVVFQIGGKWFMLMQLDAPEPRIAVKIEPELGLELRERYDGVCPAYHMNKRHWNDIYLNQIDETLVKELIQKSYNLVLSKLPKKIREQMTSPHHEDNE